MTKRLAITLLLALPMFAAQTNMQVNVRTTGNDQNGAFYDNSVSVPGTDFSLQDAAQIAYTDLIIGATTTQFTSVLNPVDGTIVGNGFFIVSGTGCNTGYFEVLSRATTTATADRSLGTAASVCTANLGGAALTVANALNVSVNTGINAVNYNIQKGTYTVTTAIGLLRSVSLQGYKTTYGDLPEAGTYATNVGDRPTITTATNSINVLNCNGGNVYRMSNINFSTTAGTPASLIGMTSSNPFPSFMNCKFSGGTIALDGGASAVFISAVGVEITSTTTAGIQGSFSGAVQGSWIHDNTKDGINNTSGGLSVSQTVFSTNGRYCISSSQYGTSSVNNVFYNCGLTFTGHPFQAIFSTTTLNCLASNNIFWGGLTSYINSVATVGSTNARDSQTIQAASVYTPVGDVVISVDPFTNAAGGDFSLNNTLNGGKGLRKAGTPGTGPAGIGAVDIGAIQTTGLTGGGQVSFASGN